MRRVIFPLLITLAAVGTIVGTFLPWLRSGKHDRSSYQMLTVLDSIGYAPDGPVGWAVRGWPLVPLICVVAAVTTWRGMWPVSSLAGLAGGSYGLGLAVVMRGAPSTSFIYPRWGSTWTLVCALVLLAVSLAQAGEGMRRFLDDADRRGSDGGFGAGRPGPPGR